MCDGQLTSAGQAIAAVRLAAAPIAAAVDRSTGICFLLLFFLAEWLALLVACHLRDLACVLGGESLALTSLLSAQTRPSLCGCGCRCRGCWCCYCCCWGDELQDLCI
jgi:hypothetical protein